MKIELNEMKNIYIALFCLTFIPLLSQAQTAKISGRIYAAEKPLELISVSLKGTAHGTLTDVQGHFELSGLTAGEYKLEIKAIGYQTAWIPVNISKGEHLKLEHQLTETEIVLDEVVISGTLKEVSRMDSPVPIEVYQPSYFQKNPTPALFEALQIVNGVRPQINCSVCNTGDIHINGMEGPYTMILIDGMPIVSGLSTVYGLNGIPNSMIERVEIVKGPASTLYGSEAVGGLVNVITKKPENGPSLHVDAFATDWREYNLDIGTSLKMKKANALLGINAFSYQNPIDRNDDGFTDITLANRISVFNKWSFNRKHNRLASLAGRYVYEDRWGGQMNWTPAYRGGDEIYGESILTSRLELIGSYQLPVGQEHMLLQGSVNTHKQDAVYGDVPYIADQRIAFGQFTWDKMLGGHDLLIGTALRYTYYDDNTPATRLGDEAESTNQPDQNWLPGVFVQDEISLSKQTRLLLGMRYDYHSEHGNIFTPRLNFKWSPGLYQSLRLSAGTGYRVVNLFTEDHAATTGAREVVIAADLLPETSFNVNLNYQRKIPLKGGLLSLDGTIFYTHFTNKIVADYETHVNQIIYDNLTGYAISKGLSLNVDAQFDFPLYIRAGMTLMDVFSKEENNIGEWEKIPQLLTERFSGTFTASYTFQEPGMTIDYTGNLIGPMKLPLLSELDQRAPFSQTYSIQNVKVSKFLKHGLTVYGGVKNLLNFTPPADAIARAHDPFDRRVLFDGDGNVIPTPENPQALTFDPTYVFTSNQGLRAFLGISWKLNQLKK